MDITFFKNQPYYLKTNVQGENFIQEYQLWENETQVYPSSHIPEAPSLTPDMENPKVLVPKPSFDLSLQA